MPIGEFVDRAWTATESRWATVWQTLLGPAIWGTLRAVVLARRSRWSRERIVGNLAL